MKHWIGAEPGLGFFVLLVSLPLVAALAYIAVYGAIEDPSLFARFATLYGAGLFIGYAIRHIRKRRAGPPSSD